MRGGVLTEIMAEDCVASYGGERKYVSKNQSETYDDSSFGITDEHDRLHVRAPVVVDRQEGVLELGHIRRRKEHMTSSVLSE